MTFFLFLFRFYWLWTLTKLKAHTSSYMLRSSLYVCHGVNSIANFPHSKFYTLTEDQKAAPISWETKTNRPVQRLTREKNMHRWSVESHNPTPTKPLDAVLFIFLFFARILPPRRGLWAPPRTWVGATDHVSKATSVFCPLIFSWPAFDIRSLTGVGMDLIVSDYQRWLGFWHLVTLSKILDRKVKTALH